MLWNATLGMLNGGWTPWRPWKFPRKKVPAMPWSRGGAGRISLWVRGWQSKTGRVPSYLYPAC